MFLLCKAGDNHMEWCVISTSPDAEPLAFEAERLNRKDFEESHAKWLAGGMIGGKPLTPDEASIDGWSRYFIREAPDWPEVSGA